MSEPQRKTRFAALAPLRKRLEGIHKRGNHPQSVESSLVDLVDALEEAAYQVAFARFIGENFDNHGDLRNLAGVEKDLDKVAAALQGALNQRNSYFRF